MELEHPAKFCVAGSPGQPIHFECEGDPMHQMQILVSAMEGNDHARAMILSVCNFWIEKGSTREQRNFYNKLKKGKA